MFAKKARSLNRRGHFGQANFSRGFGLRRNAAAVRPCNDNQPVRLITPQRRNRPVLFCRWQRTPAGRLECNWHDESTGEEPGISWSRAVLRRNWAMIAHLRNKRGRKTKQWGQSNRGTPTTVVGSNLPRSGCNHPSDSAFQCPLWVKSGHRRTTGSCLLPPKSRHWLRVSGCPPWRLLT
jgi:hypothetical protein